MNLGDLPAGTAVPADTNHDRLQTPRRYQPGCPTGSLEQA
jgi:hypothetical protein